MPSFIINKIGKGLFTFSPNTVKSETVMQDQRLWIVLLSKILIVPAASYCDLSLC